MISPKDNVATALDELQPGSVRLLGEAASLQSEAAVKIPRGHKLALRDIADGEKIIKYEVVIGQATTDIRAGEWVHLHNIRSIYDERSSHLDIHTGAPKDTKYE
ncbi:MAG: UxaA family hydrolase [Fretibacterium sp.]|nr:UxaA family hydrolase [Fretibacterium sp.]